MSIKIFERADVDALKAQWAAEGREEPKDKVLPGAVYHARGPVSRRVNRLPFKWMPRGEWDYEKDEEIPPSVGEIVSLWRKNIKAWRELQSNGVAEIDGRVYQKVNNYYVTGSWW